MPEVRHAPRRWIVVSLAIIVLAMIAIGSAAYTVTVAQRSQRQEAEILALKVKARATEQLRASERKATEARKRSECRSSRKSVQQARTIVEDLRSTYLELAANAMNPDFVAALKKRARNLPRFPIPTCDPGGE